MPTSQKCDDARFKDCKHFRSSCLVSSPQVLHTQTLALPKPNTMTERRIVALNNSGVNALSSGRFDEAILSFRHAMDCLNNIHRHSVRETREGKRMESRLGPFALCAVPLACLVNVNLAEISPSNMFDIYPCAFQLGKNSSIISRTHDTMIVLLHNLALAKHLRGLFTQNTAHLMEARHYYQMALMCTFPPHIQSRLTYETLVILGCASNLGHIHSHFWNTAKAQDCYDFIDGVLLEFSARDDTFSQDDVDFFFAVLSVGAVARTFRLAPAA